VASGIRCKGTAELLGRVRAELPVIGQLGNGSRGPGVGLTDRAALGAPLPLTWWSGWLGGGPARWPPGGFTWTYWPPPSLTPG
jgi:hypothetical protein